MPNRRQLLKIAGASIATACIAPQLAFKSSSSKNKKATFRFCLNTSTIRGQNPGLLKYIEIASQAGYEGIELWVGDVKKYLDEGNSASGLKKLIIDSGLTVENAIGFATWMVADDKKRKAGFAQMKEEMEMMASIGCKRIAAAPAGVQYPVDLLKAGEYYKQLLDLGRETGVMPQLEFWGAHKYFYHFSQVMMVAAAANDLDVQLLPDIYHLFRGGSGFESLKMLSGNVVEIFHMNDYPANIPREKQKDSDRVYPGDGVAPTKEILSSLSNMGGTKVLSVEVFNPEYWKQDALLVASTALEKTKKLVDEIQ